MILKRYTIALFIFVCLLSVLSEICAQTTYEKRHIEVSLRMIGHKVLLSAGDSSARVMPIVEHNGQYRIQFESEFALDPEGLLDIVQAVVSETKIANDYIVDVQQCGTAEVVYSFEMSELEESNLTPCRTRALPKSCYTLLFTLKEAYQSSMALGSSTDSLDGFQKETGAMPYSYLLLGILPFALLVFLFLNRKKKAEPNPNLIALGDFQFNKQKAELLNGQGPIKLTNKEAELLLLLSNSVNTTVERDVILNVVWGDQGDYVGRTLDVFVSKLRKKLETDANVNILNVRGVGYKLMIEN